MLPGTPLRASTPLRQEAKPVGHVDDFFTPTKRGRSESHLAAVETVESQDAVAGAEEESQAKAETKESKAELKKAKRKEKAERKEAEKAERAERAAAAAAAAAEKKAAEEAEKLALAQTPSQTQIAPPGASNEERATAATSTADIVKDLTPSEAAASAKSSVVGTAGKKKHPGKIDITAAVLKGPDAPDSSQTTPVKAENIARATFSNVASSRPQSPSVSLDTASKKLTAPRTLRIAPKVDTPPPAPVVAPAIRSVSAATSSRMPSRQPSIASIHPPGTPGSEHISDDISITSTSLSRANSPPPMSNRVGSAPVRLNTKSQQKKVRQERARHLEEETRMATSPVKEEPVQEAITSRKKKSKKPSTPAASSTPVPSRPASPKIKAKPEEPPKEEKPATPVKVETRAPSPAPAPAPVTPVQAPPPPPAVIAAAALTPASLVAEMRNEHGVHANAVDAFLRPFPQTLSHYKPSQAITTTDLGPNKTFPPTIPDLTKEDVENLLAGQPWRPKYDEHSRLWDRVMVTPGGAILRYMEPAHEDRYLALEKQHLAHDSTHTFNPRPNTLPLAPFPHIDLPTLHRTLTGHTSSRPTRSANAMEKAVEEGSKKGSFLVDTANKYVNEFIMPPVPLTPPSEKIVAGAEEQRAGFSVEELERLLGEARKGSEEREAGLKRKIKLNRKIAGLTH